ncbi:MAG: hypothetical protein GY838_01635 [bacterium]|nr:hypothetical protein [bacterium]
MTMRYRLGCPLLFLMIVAGAACVPNTGVRTIPAPGVDRIPTTLAMHALLSNPLPVSPGHPRRYRAMGHRSAMAGTEIHLVPPTESELAVTPAGQLLTGELSARLSAHGFDLLELPYETVDNDGTVAYTISLATLAELRHELGLGAVLVGNVFCSRVGGRGLSKVIVEAAYLKVIDTATLEVLCQVSVPYDEYGHDLHDVAGALADELARMAGLVHES